MSLARVANGRYGFDMEEPISLGRKGESSPGRVAVVCTLDPAQRASQELEWADLRDLATETHRLPDGVVATFAAAHAEMISDLVTREIACCGSWLSLDVTRTGDQVRLRITADSAEGRALIHSFG